MGFVVSEKDQYLLVNVNEKFLNEDLARKIINKLSEGKKPLVVLDLSNLEDLSVVALKLFAEELEGKQGLKLAVFGPAFIARMLDKEQMARNFMYVEGDAVSNSGNFDNYAEIFTEVVVSTVKEIFTKTTNTDVSPGAVTKNAVTPPFGTELGASIKLCTTPFEGSMYIAFEYSMFKELMCRFLKNEDIDPALVASGMPEILNIINGGVKRRLNEKGFGMENELPQIVEAAPVCREGKCVTITIPFSSEIGKFYLELLAFPKI